VNRFPWRGLTPRRSSSTWRHEPTLLTWGDSVVEFAVLVLIAEGNRILLTKREDFEVWCLPGGAVDLGESVAQAAIREAREETGLEVELTRLVGIYSRPSWNAHTVAFLARPIGGAIQPQVGEVVDAGFFDAAELPTPLIPWHRRPIRDARDGVGGSAAWTDDQAWPFEPGLDRKAVYALRDQSGLGRAEFFTRFFGRPGPADKRREV
jgi:ADP-ribose pyrophosphatase YjhB (NUDIX family)